MKCVVCQAVELPPQGFMCENCTSRFPRMSSPEVAQPPPNTNPTEEIMPRKKTTGAKSTYDGDKMRAYFAKHPSIAATRITTALKLLSKFTWEELGRGGAIAQEGIATLTDARTLLEQQAKDRAAARGGRRGKIYTFKSGDVVNVKPEHREAYAVLPQSTGLKVVELRKTTVVVGYNVEVDHDKTPAVAFIPAKHLELASEAPARADAE